MGVAVKIRGLVKKFGNFAAVNGLNLDIEEGEIFGLLGPNGSGKSTTLLIIATVYKPTEGDVEVHGHSVTKSPDEVRRLVGIAFQEPKALWVDNPYELLVWHAMVVGYSFLDARRAVREIMEELEIWEHRGKLFSELSGGTRKKVEIAKLFLQKPKVAIFDEPTAQLDVTTRHKVWDMIEALKEERRTIIVATNDMAEADRLSDRLGIIYKGNLKALGTPAELKDRIPAGDVMEFSIEGQAGEHLLAALSRALNTERVNLTNGTLKVYVNRAEEKVAVAIETLSKMGVKVRSVSIKEPTLDDVFFYFTGAQLREGR
ncbi:MAG: ATP-binding cassette domain-containing protein [Acidilobaceae archaeon]|nr:ATP-binding cassette domain-containing protein [Acidilobaceae archaeon]MCX8165782.1 ATP-binding cassette domain-containing protein [Acidilobaceae archaeon]MDW7974207.1 ATP-binding cassette domain-containing protein [Sulfolobales archaeon]